ncbi:hypothetical protein ACLB2K_070259 [Fragaria x ananassa]
MKRKQTNAAVCSYFLILIMAIGGNTSIIPVNVGVILDMDDPISTVWLSCINMTLSDFYASHGSAKTRQVLSTRDSRNDDVVLLYVQLLQNVQVQAIIGPVSSMQANFLIDLGEKAHMPMISFSATSPSLTSHPSSYFFRAAQTDSSQVKAITAIVQAFGWREAVPIYIDNAFGEGVLPYLVDACLARRSSSRSLPECHTSNHDE